MEVEGGRLYTCCYTVTTRMTPALRWAMMRTEWMTENQLKLNDGKTEALLFPISFSLKPSTGPLPDSITLGSHNIPFSDSARNPGFILDSKLSTKKHIIKICQAAYFALKHISSIRRFLTEDAAKTLVTSHILSRLDYCNCLLMGTPNSVIQSL